MKKCEFKKILGCPSTIRRTINLSTHTSLTTFANCINNNYYENRRFQRQLEIQLDIFKFTYIEFIFHSKPMVYEQVNNISKTKQTTAICVA